MLEVSNADRVVFPDIAKTKGDVVAYYDRIAERALPHVLGRPLSIMRYPKGLSERGFFQKNVPPHYPKSIARFGRARSASASKKHKDPKNRERDETLYPVLSAPEHLPYLANQGAIELHIPTARVSAIDLPDRFIVDLDPPPGATALVQRAALLVRAALSEFGLPCLPMATGSKGYHLVAPITPSVDSDQLALTAFKLATLLSARHPDELTITYRVALRGQRVFLDWLRNNTNASAIAPFSLRANARARVATPLAWDELASTPPDAFGISDIDKLLDRLDPLFELMKAPADPQPFVDQVFEAFERSGLVLEPFDRFRS
ncbi:MAG TPA: non-homologous end-joining DNA ligase [Polyangiales bacterium]|nr:non-homologous end-joining DNA ligase [Polyangiales bacterium]